MRFAKAILTNEGWVPEGGQTAFLDAGYGQRELLDGITIVALKTLSNYTNHLADTPLEEAFQEKV